MSNERHRRKKTAVTDSHEAAAGPEKVGDAGQDDAVGTDEGDRNDLFGLGEDSARDRPVEQWPSDAQLTNISDDISGAGDWVIQLDGFEIELAEADQSRGSRIQMWDGSELIFDDDIEAAETNTARKRKTREGG